MAAPADTTMRRTLQDLGLHDIYATLAAEEIDDSVFCDLQDGDLKELSISRGHRRKILLAWTVGRPEVCALCFCATAR